MRCRRRASFAGAFAVACAAGIASAQAQLPSTVYIWPMGNPSQNEMMASLAGVVNRTTNGELLLSPDNGGLPNPRFWLDRLKEEYSQVQSQVQSNPLLLINQYKSKLSGYVLYDRSVNPDSINIATSIAGVTDALIVNPSTQINAVIAGLPQIADARNMTYADAYAQYGPQFNKEMIFHQNTWSGFDHHLRDFAIQNRGFMYWSNPTALNPYVSNQNPRGRVFGWATSEFEIFKQASEAKQQVVASDWSWSNSTTARWRVPVQGQKYHAPGDVQTKPGKHYVAFVMSDGDNAQVLTNSFGSDPKWFGSSHRGKFDMNWDFTPSLIDMNPVAHNWYYQHAGDGTSGGRDTFVTAHGLGTTYPSSYPLADIQGLATNIADAMQRADHKVVSILDNSFRTDRLDPIVAQEQVLGMMYKTNAAAYKGRNGRLNLRDGKPIVAVRYSLWDKLVRNEQGEWVPHGDGASAVDIINALKGPTTTFDPIDGNADPNNYSYSIVNVHPWSVQFGDGSIDTTGATSGNPMDNVWQIVQALRADGRFEIVGLEEMMIHIRNHFGRPVPGARITATWKANSDTDWGTTRNNWSGALPNFIDTTVNFGGGFITANRAIHTTTPVTAGTINFDNASFTYRIGGLFAITLDTTSGPAGINVLNGNHNINAPLVLADDAVVSVAAGGTLTVMNLQPTARNVTKEGPGTLAVNNIRAGSLEVNGGVVRMTPNGGNAGVSRVGSLSIAAGGRLDLKNNKLIVIGGDLGSWNGSAYSGITGLIQSGRGDGSWNGDSGIITSMTAATDGVLTMLAVARADDIGYAGGTFGGQSVSAADLLVFYTWGGDADLDGDLDGDDYFRIDSHIGQSGSGPGGSGFHNGDFDYDGDIDGDDYFIIDSNISTAQNSPSFPTGAGASVTAVPEPSGVVLLVPLMCIRGGRRARCRRGEV